MTNRHIVLVCGKSASGKTASLKDLKDPRGVFYLNCESGKELPFPAKFRKKTITDPKHIPIFIEKAEERDDIHTIVIDTVTFMMDMYESVHVLPSSNTMKAWGDYAQFFKQLMQKTVAESSKNIVMLAHTSDVFNEGDMVTETMVKVKGSLMNQGIESYFNNVIACKKVPISKLTDHNDLLHISPEDEARGFKYVFQTKLTKETSNERIRGPMMMWDENETFIDNNLQQVLDRQRDYYADDEDEE
jgi:hypothetical protein